MCMCVNVSVCVHVNRGFALEMFTKVQNLMPMLGIDLHENPYLDKHSLHSVAREVTMLINVYSNSPKRKTETLRGLKANLRSSHYYLTQSSPTFPFTQYFMHEQSSTSKSAIFPPEPRQDKQRGFGTVPLRTPRVLLGTQN